MNGNSATRKSRRKNAPPPKSHWTNIYIGQGSFVSSILSTLGQDLYVIEELKQAFQSEGVEGVEFEPTEIVDDARPSKDKKKLPVEQIPQFYRVKLLTAIPFHQDYMDFFLCSTKLCPECGKRTNIGESKFSRKPLILDKNRHPGTDFFGVDNGDGKPRCHLCTAKGKAFLEKYPQTYCRFEQVELRD